MILFFMLSCFDANAGIFEILLGKEDAVFSDELNHASIIDGIRLCKAQKFRYLHKDMKDLESKLQSSNARIKLNSNRWSFQHGWKCYSFTRNLRPSRQVSGSCLC
ncbi:2-amino-3-ketobutyrate coenzyme A ligase, mitochondrial [Armadillidium vulgare]|nr:2-amino-3-ketobutyrate coenzyme A ligase, mitochondrial [Armadillidium vulgare]